VVSIGRSASSADAAVSLPWADLTAGNMRRSSDGWHAVLRFRGTEHRLWLKDPPTIGAGYIVELPFDDDFEVRAYASRRLWRAINGHAPGPAFHDLSVQRRERFALALRALDGRSSGNTYRAIADGLFGARRIPERDWKTHDLRNRTIRLVQSGLALMRGGYRELLRFRRRRK
jgi:hypothetical protein